MNGPLRGVVTSRDGIPLVFEAHGRRAWTMAAFGEDVVAVVEQLGIGQMVLVGTRWAAT
jgi:hypothetical protein